MKMERAMPARADLFARGFKVCGFWGGEVVDVVGVVRSRMLNKTKELKRK